MAKAEEKASIEAFLAVGQRVTLWLWGEPAAAAEAHREQEGVIVATNEAGILLDRSNRPSTRGAESMFWPWSSVAGVAAAPVEE